jgi:hypothetical protein
VVHSKFQNTKIKIEERMIDNEVKFMLSKVWIQFTGLPYHLWDFLIIWVVGSIMGVSKDVDMEFIGQHGIGRLHVMVINHNLIPQSVSVAIGEGLYELKFRVEMNGASGAPQPMDMDDNHEADDPGQGEKNSANPTIKQITLGDNAGSGGAAGSVNKMGQGASQGLGRSIPLFFIQEPHGSVLEGMDTGVAHVHAGEEKEVQQDDVPHLNCEQVYPGGNQIEGEVEDVPLEEDSPQADSMDTNELVMTLKEWGDEEENSRPLSAEELRPSLRHRRNCRRLEEVRDGLGWLMRKWELWLSTGKL